MGGAASIFKSKRSKSAEGEIKNGVSKKIIKASAADALDKVRRMEYTNIVRMELVDKVDVRVYIEGRGAPSHRLKNHPHNNTFLHLQWLLVVTPAPYTTPIHCCRIIPCSLHRPQHPTTKAPWQSKEWTKSYVVLRKLTLLKRRIAGV